MRATYSTMAALMEVKSRSASVPWMYDCDNVSADCSAPTAAQSPVGSTVRAMSKPAAVVSVIPRSAKRLRVSFADTYVSFCTMYFVRHQIGKQKLLLLPVLT